MPQTAGDSNLNGIETIVLFSLAAIAALAAVMHKTGKSNKASLSGRSDACRLMKEQVPDAAISDVELSTAGDQALAQVDGSSSLILLRALGSRWVVRTVDPGDVSAVSARENVVQLRFKDFADPAARLLFDSDQSAANWASRLAVLRDEPATAEAQT